MTTLNKPCYTIQDGGIVEGTLADFTQYIETANCPAGTEYYVDTTLDDVWCVARWCGSQERIVTRHDTEAEAEAMLESLHESDILNNPEIMIYLDRAAAEKTLEDQK